MESYSHMNEEHQSKITNTVKHCLTSDLFYIYFSYLLSTFTMHISSLKAWAFVLCLHAISLAYVSPTIQKQSTLMKSFLSTLMKSFLHFLSQNEVKQRSSHLRTYLANRCKKYIEIKNRNSQKSKPWHLMLRWRVQFEGRHLVMSFLMLETCPASMNALCQNKH